jgi:hypothetical protein
VSIGVTRDAAGAASSLFGDVTMGSGGSTLATTGGGAATGMDGDVTIGGGGAIGSGVAAIGSGAGSTGIGTGWTWAWPLPLTTLGDARTPGDAGAGFDADASKLSSLRSRSSAAKGLLSTSADCTCAAR